MQKGALILEGGSLRCLFTAGVLDVLMDGDIWFEYVNGVSGGSLCGFNYIVRQPGRTRVINESFCSDRRYLSFHNMLHNGGVFNFNFLFGEVCENLYPLDWEAYHKSQQEFEVVATDCLTGKPTCFSKNSMSDRDFMTACRASSSMPGLSEIVRIHDVPYLDGGCSCHVAFRRAIDLGHEKRVVVMTRPYGFRKKPDNKPGVDRMFDRVYDRYPAFRKKLHRMPRDYNAEYTEIERLERAGELFVIRPAGPVIVGRLERNPDKLEELYQQGRRAMMDQLEPMMQYLHG